MKFNAEIHTVSDDYVLIRVYGFWPPIINLNEMVAEGFDFELEEGKELRVEISEP